MIGASVQRADVVIAGCGPAGALAGSLLARAGFGVVAIHGAPRPSRIEGFGQRTVDALHAHGLNCALRTIGNPVARQVHWAGGSGAHNQEYIVARARIDCALAEDARMAGVRLVAGRCGRIEKQDAGVRVTVDEHGGDRRQWAARFFVEARGRAAPHTCPARLSGPPTTALVRRANAGGKPGTMVESFRNGWAWYVSDGELANLQIFVDSSETLPKRAELAGLHEDLRRRLQHIATPECSGPVMSRNAASQMHAEVVSARTLRLGDAAAAIDPLSGHGVFAALGSGLAAFAVINTILTMPENAGLAQQFYRERTEHGALRNARIGRDFYRLETRWADEPFWARRQAWPDDEAAHGEQSADSVRIAAMPVVANGVIVSRDVVITPEHPRGVWRVDDVEMAPLLAALQKCAATGNSVSPERLAVQLEAPAGAVARAITWLRSTGALS